MSYRFRATLLDLLLAATRDQLHLQAAHAQKAAPKVPDGVVFETDLEYANPDGQHLQLDLARPKEGDGPFPARDER